MEDLGAPSSYLALEPGAPVLFSDGEELGRVHRVVEEADADIFEGLEVERGGLSGGRCFVTADRVDEIYERGVVLRLDSTHRGSFPEARE